MSFSPMSIFTALWKLFIKIINNLIINYTVCLSSQSYFTWPLWNTALLMAYYKLHYFLPLFPSSTRNANLFHFTHFHFLKNFPAHKLERLPYYYLVTWGQVVYGWMFKYKVSKRGALSCRICQFPWYKYSNRGFHNTNMMLLNVELGRDVHNRLSQVSSSIPVQGVKIRPIRLSIPLSHSKI